MLSRLEVAVMPWPARLWFGYSALVLPAICFTLSFYTLGLAEWQDGQIQTFVAIFLERDCSTVFVSIAAFSWISALLVLIAPSRSVKWWPIRLGLWTGMVVALQYVVLVGSYFLVRQWWPDLLMLVAAAFGIELAGIAVVAVFCALRRKLGRRSPLFLSLLLATAWVVGSVWSFYEAGRPIGFVQALLRPLGVVGAIVAFGSLVMAPVWAVDSYARLALRAWRCSGSRAEFFALPLWSAAWIFSWREAIDTMFEVYIALPAYPPDCFVATAAAKGHSKVVGAVCIELPSGAKFMRTRQLQTLKAFELILMATTPRLHRILRSSYNQIGPRLAERVRSAWQADLAWLVLEPVAWLASIVVYCAASPRAKAVIKRIYGPGAV